MVWDRLFVRLFVLHSSHSFVTPVSFMESKRNGRDPSCVIEALRPNKEPATSCFQDVWHSVHEKWHSACSQMSTSHSSLLSIPIHEDADWDNKCDADSALDLLESDGSSQWWQNNPSRFDDLEDEEPPTELPDAAVHASERSYRTGRLMMLIGELLYLLRPIVCIFALRKCDHHTMVRIGS